MYVCAVVGAGESLDSLCAAILACESVPPVLILTVNIEQTNNNTISGKMDLDGIVSGLTDAMYEAVEISAEGVHI